MVIKYFAIVCVLFLSFCQNDNSSNPNHPEDTVVIKNYRKSDSVCKDFPISNVKIPTMIRNCSVLVSDSLNDYLNLNLPRLDLSKFNVLPDKCNQPLTYSLEGDMLYVSYLVYGPKYRFRFDKVHSKGDSIFLTYSHSENMNGLSNIEYFKENRVYIKVPDTNSNYVVIFQASGTYDN